MRRLGVMAVAAVLLATVLASSIPTGGGPSSGPGDPRASFTFERDGTAVVVTHFGGDTLDGANVSIRVDRRGRLGTMAGGAGEAAGAMACSTPVTRVAPGSTCRVADAAFERLLVVWEGPEGRTLILSRRPAVPTPTPVPTTSAVTPTDSPPTGTEPTSPATGTQTTPTDGGTTAGPTTGTVESTPTDTPGSAPTGTSERTATGTPGGNATSTSGGTATPS